MPVRSDMFKPVRSSERGKTVSLMQTKLPLCNYDMRHNCPGRLNEWPPAVTGDAWSLETLVVPKLGLRQGPQDNFKVVVQDLNTQIVVGMLQRGCRSIKNLANHHKIHIKLPV